MLLVLLQVFIMAHDSKQKKSLLYRLSWNNNGKQLNTIAGELLGLGQQCIDVWITGSGKDVDGIKLLHKFENIDRILLDLQGCIMNVLNRSSLAYKIFEDRVEFRNKLSEYKCETKISKLQERIGIERGKYQLLLGEIAILTKEKQNLVTENQGLKEIFRNKEEALKKENNILIENLKQQLCGGDKELDKLRFQIRTELTNLKHKLGMVNRENYKLRQRLLQIPVLEQNFDQQRQKLILETRKAIEKNHNLKQGQISSPKKNNFKLKEREYQKNINTLEESVAYFARRYHELKLKYNLNSLETNNCKEESAIDHQQTDPVIELEEPHNRNNVKRYFKANQQNNKREDTSFEESNANVFAAGNNRPLGDKEEVPDNTNDVKIHSRMLKDQKISKGGNMLSEEIPTILITGAQVVYRSKDSLSKQNRKAMGDKEEAD